MLHLRMHKHIWYFKHKFDTTFLVLPAILVLNSNQEIISHLLLSTIDLLISMQLLFKMF